MKLCKDCKHYIVGDIAQMDRCDRRTIDTAVFLVRGGPSPFGFCEETRSNKQQCGPDGNWFEPKADAA